MIRTWIPKVREKIKVAWAQAVFEDLSDIINSILTHKQASPIDHPDGSVTNEKIADGTIDLTKKCTYVPVNKAGDTMTGPLTLLGRIPVKVYESDLNWVAMDSIKLEFPIGYWIISSQCPVGIFFTTNDIRLRGHVFPFADNTYDLGCTPYRFRDIYLSGHVRLPASKNILGRRYDGTAKTVTETTYTLKDEVLPVSPKSVIYPKHVIVSYINPTNSGVVLDYELKLLHSDNDETVAFSRTGISPGSSGSDDLAEEVLADAFKDGCSVTGIRLYARVSGTPTIGYEPTVTLIKVRGVQF